MNSQQLILLVEDDLLDVYLLKQTFEKLKITTSIEVAQNGAAAIEFLTQALTSDPEEHPLPALVLLDMKLPLISGLEVLRWIRGHSALGDLPVVVFSSSGESSDIHNAAECGANGYFLKTGSLKKMQQLVTSWRDLWLLKTSPIGLEELDLLQCREPKEEVL